MAIKEHKSSIFNLNANIVTLIAYIGAAVIGTLGPLRYGTFILPLIIFLLETNSTFVKKNALQATTLNILSILFYIVFGIIAVIARPEYAFDWPTLSLKVVSGSTFIAGVSEFIRWAVAVIVLVFSIIATVKSYNYEEYEIPFINKISIKLEGLLSKIINKSTNVKVEVAQKADETNKTTENTSSENKSE